MGAVARKIVAADGFRDVFMYCVISVVMYWRPGDLRCLHQTHTNTAVGV